MNFYDENMGIIMETDKENQFTRRTFSDFNQKWENIRNEDFQ